MEILDVVDEAGEDFLHTPDTWMYELRMRTEAALLAKGPERFMAELRAAHRAMVEGLGAEHYLDAMDVAWLEGAAQIKGLAAEDARYSQLMKLARRAHEQVPLSPLVAFSLVSYDERNQAWLYSAGPVHDLLEAAPGERRAKALKHALHDVLETVYEPYLKAIIILCDCAAGREVKLPRGSLGVLVEQAGAAIRRVGGGAEYPDLVDLDAGWLRNATSHRSHLYWRYLPAEDELAVRDLRREPVRFSVDELLDRAQGLWSLAGPTFCHVASTFMMRDFFVGTGLARKMSAVFKYWALEDDESAAVAAEDYQNHLEMVVEPLVRWGRQRQGTAG